MARKAKNSLSGGGMHFKVTADTTSINQAKDQVKQLQAEVQKLDKTVSISAASDLGAGSGKSFAGEVQKRLVGYERAEHRRLVDTAARNRASEMGLAIPKDRDQLQFERFISGEKSSKGGLLSAMATMFGAYKIGQTASDFAKVGWDYSYSARRTGEEAGQLSGMGFGRESRMLGFRANTAYAQKIYDSQRLAHGALGPPGDWVYEMSGRGGEDRDRIARMEAADRQQQAFWDSKLNSRMRFAASGGGRVGDPMTVLSLQQDMERRQLAKQLAGPDNLLNPEIAMRALGEAQHGEFKLASRRRESAFTSLSYDTEMARTGRDAAVKGLGGDSMAQFGLHIKSGYLALQQRQESELVDADPKMARGIKRRQAAELGLFAADTALKMRDFAYNAPFARSMGGWSAISEGPAYGANMRGVQQSVMNSLESIGAEIVELLRQMMTGNPAN